MASLPNTYSAVVLEAAGSPFAHKEVELKRPSANYILVKVLACGICFTDVILAAGHLGPVFPRTPGHEIVGNVVAVGDGVEGFEPGQRVGGPWHGGHDGVCRNCSHGHPQMCEKKAINGVTMDGGFAEYVLLRKEAVVRVPEDMDVASVAPLMCAGVAVFNGMRRLHVTQGTLVAVQGLGGVGHLAVQFASKMGYEVAVLSSGDDKADFAKQLGAKHYINTKKVDGAAELMKLGGASMIVQTAPNPEAVTRAVGGLAVEGKLLNLAPVGPITVDSTTLISKGASVSGWPSGSALDVEETILFAMQHDIKVMVEKYPFADVQTAVDNLVAGKARFRNVLVM